MNNNDKYSYLIVIPVDNNTATNKPTNHRTNTSRRQRHFQSTGPLSLRSITSIPLTGGTVLPVPRYQPPSLIQHASFSMPA